MKELALISFFLILPYNTFSQNLEGIDTFYIKIQIHGTNGALIEYPLRKSIELSLLEYNLNLVDPIYDDKTPYLLIDIFLYKLEFTDYTEIYIYSINLEVKRPTVLFIGSGYIMNFSPIWFSNFYYGSVGPDEVKDTIIDRIDILAKEFLIAYYKQNGGKR